MKTVFGNNLKKCFCYSNPIRYSSRLILGIESSCDDTACAVVSTDGKILGEHSISQQNEVLKMGGILPTVAKQLHEQNISIVVENAVMNAKLNICDVDIISVTTKPGLVMSLLVGLNYAKYLSEKYRKSFIPIHHMEAHALICRLTNKELSFPYLTFLISGGHCLLAIAHSVDKFVVLGKSIDEAPGESFDKVARRLKLFNLPEYHSKSGGAAIENAASSGNASAFSFPLPLLHRADCNFSFAGLKSCIMKFIEEEEKKYDIVGDDVLPNIDDICASFQYTIAKHLCMRLQRAMEFIDQRNMIPEENRNLVVSGGVACNRYLTRAFDIVCKASGYILHVPPPKLCTDNGIMIAWNGVEKYRENIDILSYNELSNVRAEPRWPLGRDATSEVSQAAIKCKWLKLDKLLDHDIDSNRLSNATLDT